jgi:signal transduction histidine kinase
VSNFAGNVLLIEDNPGDVDLVRLRLMESQPDARIDCVNRLSDALAAMEMTTPALVLLDLNLPDSRGADTFRKIRERAPDVPVVVLSGQDDEALAVKAVHHGVQDYLIKGEFSSKHLERAMRYAVERQAMVHALDMARKQQIEFKNQFLSHVSHELRTPLTCIYQYVTLLLDGLVGPLAPEQADHLKTVLKSVNQLHAMIRDLLEATRAESGKLRVEPRCIVLAKLIEQAVAMMRPAAQTKQIGIEVGLDQHLPLVYADPDRILEVLINLLDNAIKFTPAEGSVTVKACLREADPDSVYVSVTDTGRGISPEAKKLIFDRLYQEQGYSDSSRSGLGLGLFISRELIQRHQGNLSVTSELGQGSTFTFNLPAYSLAKLLAPVITYQNALRPSFVLVQVDLKPSSYPPRGNWQETVELCLETLRRCVYVDKDLVLPPAGSPGATETLFIFASADMDSASVMTTRMREQLERLDDLRAKASLQIVSMPVEPELAAGLSLEEQVRAVAECVSEKILKILAKSNR